MLALAALYAKIPDVKANVLALGEVVSCSNEARYATEFWNALNAYRATKPT